MMAPEVRAAVADFVGALQAQGAVFSLTTAGDLHADLTLVSGLTQESAGSLAQIILALRGEIKQVLAAPTIH